MTENGKIETLRLVPEYRPTREDAPWMVCPNRVGGHIINVKCALCGHTPRRAGRSR